MKKIGRNQLCPCGSGNKFKKCCIKKLNLKDDRSFSDPSMFIQNYKELRRASRIKQCLHPDQDKCSDQIIKAHSIQNNKILKNVSDNGLVFMPCPKPDRPFSVITEYGRKEASVFTGFCGYHDKTLFQPIEDLPFNKTTDQIFLYIYRCFAHEYHKKQEMVRMQDLITTKKPSVLLLEDVDNGFVGMHLALRDLDPVKKRFDEAILNNEKDILTSIVWEFNCPIRFAASGFEVLSVDLEGNKIQDLLDMDSKCKHVFAVIFSEGQKTYCILSWLKENNGLFSNYQVQLSRLTDEEKRNYINNHFPMITENIAINPSAWENWSDYQKQDFIGLFMGIADISEMGGLFWDRLSKPSFDLFEM